MGYRSQVKIKMGKKAYNLLEKNCNDAADKYSKKNNDKDANNFISEMITDPDYFEICNEYVLIGWDYIKWYSGYEDVKSIDDTLTELDKIVEEDYNLLDDYFYKIIALGEDNMTEENTNDFDEEFVSDFYIKCEFSL